MYGADNVHEYDRTEVETCAKRVVVGWGSSLRICSCGWLFLKKKLEDKKNFYAASLGELLGCGWVAWGGGAAAGGATSRATSVAFGGPPLEAADVVAAVAGVECVAEAAETAVSRTPRMLIVPPFAVEKKR